jgi:hypothetical protein
MGPSNNSDYIIRVHTKVDLRFFKLMGWPTNIAVRCGDLGWDK